MNGRIGKLWLPRLASLALATGSWTALHMARSQPHVLWIRHMPMLLYLPWIATLPLAGAAGAYICRRAGGRPRACFDAGLFPAAVWFGLVSLGFTAMAVGSQLDRPEWLCIAVGLLNWAVLPGSAVVVGTTPFLIGTKVPERI